MPSERRATPTVEEYLEAIVSMASEKKAMLPSRLAERLRVSRPTVTATLHRMRRDDLITSNERKEIALTEKGAKMAVNIVRRHRLAERLLTDILKVPWHEVHQEACLLEHAISEKVMSKLYEILGEPATCPHGNPIPMDDVLPPVRGVPLNTVEVGEMVVVERISEEATRLTELIEYLGQAGIKPGAHIVVREVAEYAGSMQVLVDQNEYSLGTKAAALVWVIPVSKP